MHFEMFEERNSKILRISYPVIEKLPDQVIILSGILLLVLFTFPFIGSAYWTDEIFSVIISRSIPGMLNVFLTSENNMAIYYFLLHAWMNLFGESEIATRSMSVLFSAFTIAVFHSALRRYLGKSETFIADLLLVSNPLFLFYSIETRGYSLLLFFSTLATALLLSFYIRPRMMIAIMYALAVSLAIYTHYFGILLPVVHAACLLWKGVNKNQTKYFFYSSLLIILFISPLVLFHPGSFEQINWLEKPDLKQLLGAIFRLFGGKIIFVINLLIFLLIGIKFFSGVNKANLQQQIISLALISIFLPVLSVFFFSILVKPAFLLRYFIWCVPAAVILTTEIILGLRWGTLVLLLFFMLLQIGQAYPDLKNKGSGYREAVAFVKAEARDGDAVICYPFMKKYHFDYYLLKISRNQQPLGTIDFADGPYNPGGGRKDPDPDMEIVKAINLKYTRIFIICRTSEAAKDSLQNRAWLPEITEAIRMNHPVTREMIFRQDSEEPIRLLILERVSTNF